MKKFILLTGLLSAVLLSPACSGNKKNTTTTDSTKAETVKITSSDNGKTFEVSNNSTFEATFNECVGCAQVWTITTIDKDKIEVLPNTYSNRSCTDCTGGTQDNTFHFKAKATGKSELQFSYFEERVTVTIDVK